MHKLAVVMVATIHPFCSTVQTTDSESPLVTSSRVATQPPEYYVEQGERYFATLDSIAPIWVTPQYAPLVVRWEWPPWLLLTGFGRFNLLWTDAVLKLYPTRVTDVHCRAFAAQPFGRCYATFRYLALEPIDIYEEFTFNDAGEMTFIEAWSAVPGLMPTTDPADVWAEGQNVHRMSSKVPGLSSSDGRIDIESVAWDEAERTDADIAELRRRLRRPVATWFAEAAAALQKTVEEWLGAMIEGRVAAIRSK